MKIKVRYTHNKQAVEVKDSKGKTLDWKTLFRNEQAFAYYNASLNGKQTRQWSTEQREGFLGNY